jgi:hypothetical protein
MPNETNWQDITRRLDISQADVTTACQHKERAKGRAIKKIGTEFTIPSVLVEYYNNGIQAAGALVHQINFTAPRAFRILGLTKTWPQFFGLATAPMTVCIRYRVEDVVYRYKLQTTFSGVPYDIVQADNYTNQRIEPNFCIEFWSAQIQPGPISYGQNFAAVVAINTLSIPDNSDSIVNTFDSVNTQTRADLDVAFPDALPTVYGDNSCWLTN